MSRLCRALAVVAVALAATLSVATTPAGASAADDESGFLAELNGLRGSKGLPPLSVHTGLVDVARTWAGRMAEAGAISHNPGLSAQAPAVWTRLGENVGTGSDVHGLHQAFVASPSHYRNMVDDAFDAVGIGVVRNGSGTIFVTVNFMTTKASPAPAAAPAAAPAEPAPAPAAAPAPAPVRRPATPAPAPAAAAPAPVPAPVPAAAAAAPAPVAPPAETAAAAAPTPAATPTPTTAPTPAAERRAMVASGPATAAGSPAIALAALAAGLVLTLGALATTVPARRRRSAVPAYANSRSL